MREAVESCGYLEMPKMHYDAHFERITVHDGNDVPCPPILSSLWDGTSITSMADIDSLQPSALHVLHRTEAQACHRLDHGLMHLGYPELPCLDLLATKYAVTSSPTQARNLKT